MATMILEMSGEAAMKLMTLSLMSWICTHNYSLSTLSCMLISGGNFMRLNQI